MATSRTREQLQRSNQMQQRDLKAAAAANERLRQHNEDLETNLMLVRADCVAAAGALALRYMTPRSAAMFMNEIKEALWKGFVAPETECMSANPATNVGSKDGG